MVQNNNNDYNGPKTLFLSGRFYYEPNKELSSEARSSNCVNCTACSHQEKQVHSLNTTPTGSQTAQNESTMQPDATKFTHPCCSSSGMQSICRFCCMRSSFGMQAPCCMHSFRDVHTHCCLHNLSFTNYASQSPCAIHFPNIAPPCMQSHCGMNCSSGNRCQCRSQCTCRMQNPWGAQCHGGVHSPCWVKPSGDFHSMRDSQGSLRVNNKPPEYHRFPAQSNQEMNSDSTINRRDSLTLDSLHICGSRSPIDTQSFQSMNNQPIICAGHQTQKVTQEEHLITTSLNIIEPQKTLDFPEERQKYNGIQPPNPIDRSPVIEPSAKYLPGRPGVPTDSSELVIRQNKSQTVQNELSQNIAISVIEGLPTRSPNEERIDNNFDEKHQIQNKVQNDKVLSREMDKQYFTDGKDFLPSTSSIDKSPQLSKSLDCENLGDLREKLQTVFQNVKNNLKCCEVYYYLDILITNIEEKRYSTTHFGLTYSENGKQENKSSKDFCQIDGKQLPTPHKPLIIQTELKPQQNKNADKNFPENIGRELTNKVKGTIGSTIVSEVPQVRKSGFKILKIVEYVEPDKPVEKKMTPPVMNTGRFQVSKVIENNINENFTHSEAKDRFRGGKTNQINDSQKNLPVIGNRFYVTKVAEDHENKPEAPLASNENRFHASKTVDINANELPNREAISPAVTSVVDENGNHQLVKELAVPVPERRYSVASVYDENGNLQPVKELPQAARFYMCNIADKNASQPPQLQIMQVPITESRLKMNKVNEDPQLAQSGIGNGENMQSASEYRSPSSSKRNSSTDSTLLEQVCSNMDENVLFQELSVIMNEAQTCSYKIDEIESNDKLEKGAVARRAVEIKKNRTVWLNLIKLRQTLDPSYYEPTPKDYDCDIRVRLYAFLRKCYAEVHFKSFYMIAKLKEHENVDPNSKFGISLRTDCIQKLVEMRMKLDACEDALDF